MRPAPAAALVALFIRLAYNAGMDARPAYPSKARFYAVHVETGYEDSFVELMRKLEPDTDVYNIKKKLTLRKRGKSFQESRPVFPGYLFFRTPDESLLGPLVSRMRRLNHFIRVLPSTDSIKPLSDRDACIIGALLSFGGEIGPSLVTFDENNRIRVIRGALAGLEGSIVKVDRRKRRAKIRLDLHNTSMAFDLGFEVLQIAEGGKS